MEPKADACGTKRWRDERGRLHRDGGPAVERANGDCQWWQHGQLHRDGGPAIECANGDRFWYQRNVLHRADGPAAEGKYGDCEWCWRGEYLSEVEFAAAAQREQRANLAVLALDAVRRRKRRAVCLPVELWNALAEW